MKCTHSYKYVWSFEDEESYVRFEECEYCGIDKTIIIDTKTYWDDGLEEVAE